MAEDEMAGWHHRLKGHESEQAPGDSEGQGGLAVCSSRGCKESDMTQSLNSATVVREELLKIIFNLLSEYTLSKKTFSLILFNPYSQDNSKIIVVLEVSSFSFLQISLSKDVQKFDYGSPGIQKIILIKCKHTYNVLNKKVL